MKELDFLLVFIVTVFVLEPIVIGFGFALGTDALGIVGSVIEIEVENVLPFHLSPLAVADMEHVPSFACLTPLQYMSESSPPTSAHDVLETEP